MTISESLLKVKRLNTRKIEIFIKKDFHYLNNIRLHNQIISDLQPFFYSTLLRDVVISIFLIIKYIAQLTNTEKQIVIRLLTI